MTETVTDKAIELELLKQTSEGKSVAPRDIATAIAPEGVDWRRYLKRIKQVATALHDKNELVFLRKKKVVSPVGLKGVFRLAAPVKENTLHD